MEKAWKIVCLCLVFFILKLCNGLPIDLESTIPADRSVELLSEVIVILLTVCTVLLLVGCLCCHRPAGFKEFRDSPVAVSTVGNVDNGLVNPSAEGAFTIFAPLGHPNYSPSNDRFRFEEEYSYGDINVSSWFNEGAYDFPRTKLKYIKELGKGWFGSVVEGTAQDPEQNTWTPVVVRILDTTASTKEKVFFLHEAEIYKCGSHTNLLKLHGRCLNSDPFLLLQELCPQGDLKGYLLSNKSNNNLLASEYPLIWCCQITSALKFLHEKGLAHSDLACRNCQLTSNLTVKLGDYGLSPSKYPEDYYGGTAPMVSVRWCAPESIRHTTTTIQPERITREANVWSLAVCFWEVCECGARPYADLTDDEVVTQVLGKAHVRLPRPSNIVLYTDYIYTLMQSCWLTPESRPTSTQIYLTLTDLLQVFTVCQSESKSTSDLQESQESFDLRWNSLKPNNTGNFEVSNQKPEVKPMSPSMNNLIGSLDDMNRSRTSEEDNAHSVLLPGRTNQKFEFELSTQSREPLETDSFDDSMVYNMRRSSSSETEEENWKKKIERGAYTEKVRQKSRSVTDLMVLTHIDSESESETPQPSLDHRVNYKNVRLAPKHNLESASYVHGSEGNLLSVQDDFQAELRKLQEEHRDSLFFVPDKYSQSLRSEQVNNNLGIDRNNSSNERLIKELSGPSDITPVNQVYNVFSVTIDNLSPIHVVKLNEIINLEENLDYVENKTPVSYEVPKLCDIIENNSMVANFPDNYLIGSQNEEPGTSHFDEEEPEPQKLEEFNLDEISNRTYQKEKSDYSVLPLETAEKDEMSTEEKEIIQISEEEIHSNNFEKRMEVGKNEVCTEEKEISQITEEEIQSNNFEKGMEVGKIEVCTEEKGISRISEEEKSNNSSNRMEVDQTEFCTEETGISRISEVEIQSNNSENPMKIDKIEVSTDTKEILGISEDEIESNNPVKRIELEGGEETEISLKRMQNNVVKDETFKTEKIEEKCSEIDYKYYNSCVPDDESICDESVLNEKVILDLKKSESGVVIDENVNEKGNGCPDGNPFVSRNLEQNNLIEENQKQKSVTLLKENIEEDDIKLDGVLNQEGISVNTNEVQDLVEDCMKHHDVGGVEVESNSLEEIESHTASPTTEPGDSLESAVGSGEMKLPESNDVSLGSLNIENRHTLEDLFVFQMGENLNSFEMNSQISDVDLYSTSEKSKSLDSSSIHSFSRRNLFKRREDSKKASQKKFDEATGAKSSNVPKLMDLIQDNDMLMDYIITHYESELQDDLSCENSTKTITAVSEKSDDQTHKTDYPVINFDLSNSQEATNPNPLTHLNAFTSLRSKPKSSLELISSTPSKMSKDGDNSEDSNNLNYSLETWDNFLGNAIDTQTRNINDQPVVFESLTSEPQSLMFIETEGVDSTVTPPNSDIEVSLEGSFLEDVYNNQTINIEEDCDDLNKTYEVEESDLNKTYDVSALEGSFSMEENASDDQDESGTWESSGGWFLHPQSSGSVCGQITEQRDARSMDDEILAALRGELLAKLPHAQGSTSDKLKDTDEEWETSEKEEVFLRYNVYDTPLSPIPEESENEEDTDYVCTATGSPASGASDDWPEKLLENQAPQENDSQSLKAQGLHHHHTLSQDSCCSNDTLFNLEDMTFVVADQEEKTEDDSDGKADMAKRLEEERIKRDAIDYFKMGTAVGMPLESPVTDIESPMEPPHDKTSLADFLVREREHSEMVSVVVTEQTEENRSDSNSAPFKKTAAPLPSPEDHPWKQLSDSLLKKGLLEADLKLAEEGESTDSVTYVEETANCTSENVSESAQIEDDTPLYSEVGEAEQETPYYTIVGAAEQDETESEPPLYSNVNVETVTPVYTNVDGAEPNKTETPHYQNVGEVGQIRAETPIYSDVGDEGHRVPGDADSGFDTLGRDLQEDLVYVNVDSGAGEIGVYSNVGDGKSVSGYVNVFGGEEVTGVAEYDNVENVGDILNEEDYVNITNLENAKMSADFGKADCFDDAENPTYENVDDDLIIVNGEEDQDDQLMGVLTDIRFSGPGESHLMSTSFSESNDLQNEQDWESGSDTRSSSSGEFIWREGEHEESLKALQALPQDLLDDIEPSKGTREETSSDSSCTDDEGECPEFIPSAWDKYATPTKSALRSPEKTLEKEEKKKGVWFKKQRYHCVYEYPKEPDSPVLQSFDLWNNPPPATSYPEWYFDIDSNTDLSDFTTTTNFSEGDTLSTDFTTSFNNEFFVTGSATPFDMMTSTNSQFFPGSDHWLELSKMNENTTPDSGVEDVVTPGSIDRVDFPSLSSSVPSLKVLSEAACARLKQKGRENKTSDILGGLRHTRDKLKLDLPPSPNTFTSNKTFNLEPNVEPVVIRERPAFTTFGKSRFLVQQVDTPDRDVIGRNVCFDALPYKPIEKKDEASRTKKIKKEEEKGEASLLDSADEDSGIESSTLERKLSDAGKLIVDL